MSEATTLALADPPARASSAVAAPAGALISIEGLNKRFVKRRAFRDTLRHPFRKQYHQALRDVTCGIQEGEFFGLLGPNGAGKTTLFKTLATFITPDSGRVIVAGHDLRQAAERVRQVVTPAVADERSLRWRLTAQENLRLFAVLYGVPSEEVDQRARELLAMVGLSDTGHKLVGEFSTGMKQRLLIARALIPRPRILLLDEPTRGLDPVLARDFRGFLRHEIGARHGCTVLLATHNAEEAFELCDRVAILDRGRLLVAGPAAVLREQYGHQRYRLVTRSPRHAGFTDLPQWGARYVAADAAPTDEGWTTVELEMQGGLEHAAAVVEMLSSRGVAVARFERVATSLADLIERVVARSRGDADA